MKDGEKKKTSKLERLTQQWRDELKKTRPDLYQFWEELGQKLDDCRNQDELNEVWRWAIAHPLKYDLEQSGKAIVAESLGGALRTYWDGLNEKLPIPDYPKPNLPTQIIAAIEEIAPICGTMAEDNITWQTARSARGAYKLFLETKRLLKSAQKRLDEAAEVYSDLLLDLGTQLVYRGLQPFQGTAEDPLTWFVDLGELIDRGKKELPDAKLTASKVRYYSRLGLIPKPIRVGAGGKALYPPTIFVRLTLIEKMKRRGLSLKEMKARLPTEIRDTSTFVKNWEFGYHIYAKLASPETESFLRAMMSRRAEKKLNR